MVLTDLIMIAEMAYPHVFFHVGVVEILPQPPNITPVKIPFSITALTDIYTKKNMGI